MGLMRVGPLMAALVVAGIPVGRYALRVGAEADAESFLERVAAAQAGFRDPTEGRGYAASLASLTAPCAGTGGVDLPLVAELERGGFVLGLRPRDGAGEQAADCTGRPTTSDYYVAIEPRSPRALPRRAFAMTSTGQAFVFFDGVAPRERDMEPGGLATPVAALRTFTIP
ncbi:MAG: hypothetical protein ACT4QD_21840 [Acidobacteriota bacterium]